MPSNHHPQLVKNPPAMRETWVLSLGWEDPLEKRKATHSSILAWCQSHMIWIPSFDLINGWPFYILGICGVLFIMELPHFGWGSISGLSRYEMSLICYKLLAPRKQVQCMYFQHQAECETVWVCNDWMNNYFESPYLVISPCYTLCNTSHLNAVGLEEKTEVHEPSQTKCLPRELNVFYLFTG